MTRLKYSMMLNLMIFMICGMVAALDDFKRTVSARTFFCVEKRVSIVIFIANLYLILLFVCANLVANGSAMLIILNMWKCGQTLTISDYEWFSSSCDIGCDFILFSVANNGIAHYYCIDRNGLRFIKRYGCRKLLFRGAFLDNFSIVNAHAGDSISHTHTTSQ